VETGPDFVEDMSLPWLRDAAQGAGGAAEKLPEKARSAASSGSDLAEQLSERARDVTGLVESRGIGRGGWSGRRLSQEELIRRREERTKHRARRRKAMKQK
jgi:hypothetical protein